MADVQSRNIFLVCQIIRKGKMLLDDKKNISESSFRRPYACGILDVSSVLQYQPETEATAIQNEDLNSYNLPLYLWLVVCSCTVQVLSTQSQAMSAYKASPSMKRTNKCLHYTISSV